MKIQSIGHDDFTNCFLLQTKSTDILLDFPCSFEEKIKNDDCLHFMKTPEINLIDFSKLEAVLVSNIYSILGLPFLTERCNFAGKVYTTQPVFDLGKLLIKDMMENRKLSSTLIKQRDSHDLCISTSKINYYTEDEINSCFSKFEILSFLDNRTVNADLYFMAVSSGHIFGSCNWIIQSSSQKIGYISASSTFKSHSIPLHTELLKTLDFIIFSQLAKNDVLSPDAAMHQIFDKISSTIRNNGNVLFPMHPTGFIYDLIQYLSKFFDTGLLSKVPIYCISSVINASLCYANVSAEWLANERQQVIYKGEDPFEYKSLIDKNRVIPLESLSDTKQKSIKQPCVILTGDPNLSFGSSSELFQRWKNRKENTVIFTDPNSDTSLRLSELESEEICISEILIDTRLRTEQLFELLQDLKPVNVILGVKDYFNFVSYTECNDMTSKVIPETFCVEFYETLQLADKQCKNDFVDVIIPEHIFNEMNFTDMYINNEGKKLACKMSFYIEPKRGKYIMKNTASNLNDYYNCKLDYLNSDNSFEEEDETENLVFDEKNTVSREGSTSFMNHNAIDINNQLNELEEIKHSINVTELFNKFESAADASKFSNLENISDSNIDDLDDETDNDLSKDKVLSDICDVDSYTENDDNNSSSNKLGCFSNANKNELLKFETSSNSCSSKKSSTQSTSEDLNISDCSIPTFDEEHLDSLINEEMKKLSIENNNNDDFHIQLKEKVSNILSLAEFKEQKRTNGYHSCISSNINFGSLKNFIEKDLNRSIDIFEEKETIKMSYDGLVCTFAFSKEKWNVEFSDNHMADDVEVFSHALASFFNLQHNNNKSQNPVPQHDSEN